MFVKALYNHNCAENAYQVDDYPAGFKKRCQIRYWIENGGRKKGYRFVYQTTKPGTDVWCAPKKSTYSDIAEELYLDENGHVQSHGVTRYSTGAQCLEFLQNFPETHAKVRIQEWCKQKYLYDALTLQRGRTIYGDALTDTDRERRTQEQTEWLRAYQLATGTQDIPQLREGSSH
jgi:hypothetical protein